MPRSRWNWPLVPLCHWPSDKKLSKAVGSTDVCCWIYGTLAVNVFSNGSPKSENSPLSLPALIPSKPPFLSALARIIRWVVSAPINGRKQISPDSTRPANVPVSVCMAPIGSEAIHFWRRLCLAGAPEFELESMFELSHHGH